MQHARIPFRLAIAVAIAIALLIGCGDDEENPTNGLVPPPPDTLLLNEFLAVNQTTIADPADSAYDDWLELWNPGPDPASTSGLYLTDDLAQPRRFQLPDTTIPSGGHLLLWLDGEPAQGRWHAPFRLNGTGGEEAAIFALHEGVTSLIDSVTFGVQSPDISLARFPDGGSWGLDGTPTPGATNVP
jgi:hypothetical protein